MQLRTILLVACLTTVPVVAAEGNGCSETEEGLTCHAEVPSPPSENPTGDPEKADADCKPLVVNAVLVILPDIQWDIHVECITRS